MTDEEKIRRLPWLAVSEALTGIFGGIAMGSTRVLYLDALGLPLSQVGFVFSLMHLLGPIALLVGPLIARFGYKRAVVLFYGGRKIVMAMMIFAPFFSKTFMFPFIVIVNLIFGIGRVLAEIAIYPWYQEAVPNKVRGKFTAISYMCGMLTGMAAVSVAGRVISVFDGIWRFQVLYAVASIAGVCSVLMLTKVGGGEPSVGKAEPRLHAKRLSAALKDRQLTRFLLTIASAALVQGAWLAFVPLYLKNEAGIAPGTIVLLQTVTMGGSFFFSYPLGWTADRYGSKPVAMAALILMVILPMAWIAMPKHQAATVIWAVIIALMRGMANIAWNIGLNRLLNNTIVPIERRTEYMAIFYAVLEGTSFASPVISGILLSVLEKNPTFLPIGMFELFFVTTGAIVLIGVLLVARIVAEGRET